MSYGDEHKVKIGAVGLTLLKLRILGKKVKVFKDFLYGYILVLKIVSKS